MARLCHSSVHPPAPQKTRKTDRLHPITTQKQCPSTLPLIINESPLTHPGTTHNPYLTVVYLVFSPAIIAVRTGYAVPGVQHSRVIILGLIKNDARCTEYTTSNDARCTGDTTSRPTLVSVCVCETWDYWWCRWAPKPDDFGILSSGRNNSYSSHHLDLRSTVYLVL